VPILYSAERGEREREREGEGEREERDKFIVFSQASLKCIQALLCN
jgi:hypothetical protein